MKGGGSLSEFGLKIKNIQAASVYGCNLGIRNQLDTKDAMLTNSLFLDYLLEIGLETYHEKSTRDVICLEFSYGSRSYTEEKNFLTKRLNDIKCRKKDYKNLSDEKITQLIQRTEKMLEETEANKDKFHKMSKAEIRKYYYENPITVSYPTYNKKGNIIKTDKITYRMLYRTPGKAKKGTCMFIREELYEKAREFLYMGIELPYENSPIVEMGAYASLITSNIVGKIQIKPENILIIKDIDSFFLTKAISIEVDENKQCVANHIDEYKMKNTLFDGQALIDHNSFPAWGDGYVLLRHHMTKMAAFDCYLQRFFKDYFGSNYEYAEVLDMFGNKHKVKDIQLITTDNAIKWKKFGVDYDYWCKWVHKNDCMFGVVKTSHKSKLGDVQQMSYQMINSLDIDSMPNVLQPTESYINKLQTDDYFFLKYLSEHADFCNDYDVLVALVNQNRDFLRSRFFRERKHNILQNYILKVRSGKVIQNADNLTIVGSPYAMLLTAVGDDVNKDNTFSIETDCIQCFTERFNDGEYLAEFRNPFNSRNNLGYLHNVYDDRFMKYFNFGTQIIAINMIGTDFQDRNNGSDQDSDSIYVTNQKDIVKHAKYCYQNYPTIVNNIPPESNHYENTLENYAKIDNNLAAAQLAIGESSNLAQLALTYTYNYDNQIYQDYVCILSVLAQIAIDNAKRTYDVSVPDEIKRIKEQLEIKKNKYPEFWEIIKKKKSTDKFNKDKINYELVCPMNTIKNINVIHYSKKDIIETSEFFINHELNEDRRKCKQVEKLIEKYSLKVLNTRTDEEYTEEEHILLREDFDTLIKDIKQIHISKNYLGLMSWLLNRALIITPNLKGKQNVMDSTLRKNRSLILKVLYQVSPYQFLKCFTKNE